MDANDILMSKRVFTAALIFVMTQRAVHSSESSMLLRNTCFCVCKLNCGPMKAQIIRANINSHGGSLCDSVYRANIVIFDKSCEDDPDKVFIRTLLLSSSKLCKSLEQI